MKHKFSRELCKPASGQRFAVKEHPLSRWVDVKENYQLEGKLGDGAVGIVRKATRLRDQSPVAVKFLAPDLKYIDESVFNDVYARFKREGERGAKLRHPNLIKIYRYCENMNGECFASNEIVNPFLIMERIDGRTLEGFIRKSHSADRKFTITKETLNFAIQISDALEELAKQKVVHRDVKPANIFLNKLSDKTRFSLAKLGDFGIVKWGDFHRSISTGSLTVTNQKGLGTIKYMSPEQAISPKEITVKSDIFSLGISLFEMFTMQLLPTPHHVYAIQTAAASRGTILSRYFSLGYQLGKGDYQIAELLLSMLSGTAKDRPSITKVKGILEHLYEVRYDSVWSADVDWEKENEIK